MDHQVREACVAGVRPLQSFWPHHPDPRAAAGDILAGAMFADAMRQRYYSASAEAHQTAFPGMP